MIPLKAPEWAAPWLSTLLGTGLTLETAMVAVLLIVAMAAVAIGTLLSRPPKPPGIGKGRASVRFKTDWYSSSNEPAPFQEPLGAAPAIVFSQTGGSVSPTTDDRIRDMRWRAATQLIYHLGGATVPRILHTLLWNMGDPGKSVSELVRLLGFDKDTLVAGDGEHRTIFIDRLIAFAELETALGEVTSDANRRILKVLQNGHAELVHAWALSIENTKSALSALGHAQRLLTVTVRGLSDHQETMQALLSQIVEHFPDEPNKLQDSSEDGLSRSVALLSFARELSHLLERWRIAESDLLDIYASATLSDGDKRSADRLSSSFERIVAQLKISGLTPTQLRGVLADLGAVTAELEALASSAFRTSSAGGHSRSSGPEPASSTSKDDIWRYFGFDREPSMAELRRAYGNMAREHHPDGRPPEEHDEANAKMAEINDKYATARILLKISAGVSF